MARPRTGHTKFVKVEATIPIHLRELMRKEARVRGIGISDIVRLAISDRYRDLLFDADAAATSPTVRAAREAMTVEEVES